MKNGIDPIENSDLIEAWRGALRKEYKEFLP